MEKKETDNSPLYRYRVGAVEFDEARCELRVENLLVKLERKPLLVLGELLRHANEVITRQQLIDTVWNGRLMVDQALANAIRKVRRAVKDPDGLWIVTVPKCGYKCTGSVDRMVVGRRVSSQLALQRGTPVPARAEFILESQLSAGPSSEVWLARHTVNRELRVFKFSRDADGLAALQREATVLRLLYHSLGPRSDLVRLHRWDFENRPFYVECAYGGLDLLSWASKEGYLAAMSLEQRLELFTQIAVAVQAAHSTGVLHKDLKPGNVLVAPNEQGGWQVRVTDFGSASLLDPERLRAHDITKLGLTVNGTDPSSGTPWYMAPEVLVGEAFTVRCDVYSLGLMLYQIATANLRRPLTSGWENDIADELLRDDIAAATDGDPQRRLASVSDLVERLRGRAARQLQREQATLAEQRAALAERALERARARRPWLIAAAGSLIVGLGASVSLYFAEAAARQEAEQQAQRTQGTNQFLNDLLRTADPSIPGGSSKVTIEDALTRAEAKLEGQFKNDPRTKASLYATLGEVQFGLGKYEAALRLQRISKQVLTTTLGAADDATLTVQYQMARTLDLLTRSQEAQRLLESAHRLAGTRLLKPSLLALLAHWTEGGNALMQMHPERALQEFQAAETIRAQVVPNDAVWLARVRSGLAWCAVRMRRHADAVAALDVLIAAEYTPERIGVADWAKLHFQYALALRNLSQHARAAVVARDAVTEIQRLLGPRHYLVGLGWNHSAAVLMANAQWDSAIEAAEHAYQIFRDATGEHSQATLGTLGDLAILHYLRGTSADAVPRLAAAHAVLVEGLGSRSPLTQIVGFYWASALISNSIEAASKIADPLEATALAAADAGDHWELRLQALRAQILLGSGRASEGQPLLQSAVAQLIERRAEAWVIAPLQRALSQLERTAATVQ